MSTTVDSRVVEMSFENSKFKSGVQSSMSLLDKLKEKLNFKGSLKSVNELESAGKKFSMSPMEKAAELVGQRFSTMGIVATRVLQNITDSVMRTGTQMVKSLTVKPLLDGFAEYETQMNAVQTILANTQKHGTTLKDVTGALDELNAYADQTIYNFTEMTRNIGTFTAAGVDLKTSTAAIKGIANLAAVSGSTSTQASTAMYQLSQALAAGTVKLMDWNSVVNAGMGGQVFQDALIETARVHGIAIDDILKKQGSFRESLQEGWLSSEVLIETLQKFTGDLSREQLQQIGYTEEQIDQIVKLGQTANDAATKVKTLTQLKDTLAEALGSGWAKSWQIIIGDFEEAKELFTDISDELSTLINESSDVRNNILQGWKDLGGRTAIIDGLWNTFRAGMDIINTITNAMRDIFPPITAQTLADLSFKFRDFTAALIPSEETIKRLSRIFKGFFSVIDLGRQALGAIFQPIAQFLGSDGIAGVGDVILEAAASIGDFFTGLHESANEIGIFSSMSTALSGALKLVSSGLGAVAGKVKDLLGKLPSLGDIFNKIKDVVTNVASAIGDKLATAFQWLQDNFSLGDFFKAFAGVGILELLRNIIGAVSKFKDALAAVKEKLSGAGGKEEDNGGILDSFKELLGGVQETLSAFTQGIKVASVVAIAIAVTLLVGALRKIAELDVQSIVVSLAAIAGLMDLLDTSLTNLVKGLGGIKTGELIGASVALIGIAVAIRVLSGALRKIGELDLAGLAKGLVGVFATIEMLSRFINKSDLGKLKMGAAAGLIAMAIALRLVAGAVEKLGSLDIPTLAKGLVSVAAALAAMSGALRIVGKTKISASTSASFIALAIALKIVASTLDDIGALSWGEIARGLTGMAGALGILSGTLILMNKLGGTGSLKNAASVALASLALISIAKALDKLKDYDANSLANNVRALEGVFVVLAGMTALAGKISGLGTILAGGGVLIAAQSLLTISEALTRLRGYQPESLRDNVAALEGIFVVLAGMTGVIGKVSGLGSLLAGAGILVAAQSLSEIAGALNDLRAYPADELTNSVLALEGVFVVLAGMTGVIGKISGLGALLAGGGVYLASKSLGEIAGALQTLNGYPLDSLENSVLAIEGVFVVLAGMTAVVGKVAPLGALLGGGAVLLAAQALQPIADALSKLAGFDGDSVAAAVAGLSITFAAIGTMSAIIGTVAPVAAFIGGGSLLIAAQALKPIADALSEISGLDSDSIKRAVDGMFDALLALSGGTFLNTLNTLGAINVNIAVQPLKELADGLKEFASMGWDEIDRGTEAMKKSLETLGNSISAFTFGGWGADVVSTIAQPLGTLADSVSKWESVTVPEDLGENLKSLGAGIGSFGADFFAGGMLATVAAPLGTMADSVNKWNGVTVPAELPDQMTQLSEALGNFGTDFFKGGIIDSVAAPLGTLADSVKKWQGVSVPADLSTSLTGLSEGLQGFNLQFFTGGNLDKIVQPLGSLAQSVTSWNGVSVPATLSEGLSGLARGVSAFNLEFFTGDNLGKIVGPVRDLAGAVQAWQGVTFPTGYSLELELYGLKNGVAAVSQIDGPALAANVEPVKSMAGAVQAWQGMEFLQSAYLEAQLFGLKNGLAAMSQIDGGALSGNVEPVRSMSSAVRSWGSIMLTGIGGQLKGLASGLRDLGSVDISSNTISSQLQSIVTSVRVYSIQFRIAAKNLVDGFAQGFTTGVQAKMGAMINTTNMTLRTTLNRALTFVNTYRVQFYKTGSNLTVRLADGIRSRASTVSSAVRTVIQSASSGLSGYSSSFFTLGSNMMDGLRRGIVSGAGAAIRAAADAAARALAAAKAAVGSNSPAKKFIKLGKDMDEGLVIGIDSLSDKVVHRTEAVASRSLDAMKEAVASVSTVAAGDIYSDPVIRPVVDLTDAYQSAAAIDRAISGSRTISAEVNTKMLPQNIETISVSMAKQQTAIQESNNAVLNAISSLNETLISAQDQPAPEFSLYLDKKKFASTIARDMNKQLGVISRRSGI